jgi:hypothetical protein
MGGQIQESTFFLCVHIFTAPGGCGPALGSHFCGWLLCELSMIDQLPPQTDKPWGVHIQESRCRSPFWCTSDDVAVVN